jgi:hypothetical protein
MSLEQSEDKVRKIFAFSYENTFDEKKSNKVKFCFPLNVWSNHKNDELNITYDWLCVIK